REPFHGRCIRTGRAVTNGPASLFEPAGESWLPTQLSLGPWSREALHGGPVAALVAREAERCEPTHDMMVTRFSLELLRPVPVAPLLVRAKLTRPGRKIQIVDVSVLASDREVAAGRALRARMVESIGNDGVAGSPEVEGAGYPDDNAANDDVASTRSAPAVLPESAAPMQSQLSTYVGYHNTGAEVRFAKGEFGQLGPSFVWIRLRVPVVPGEDPTPLQRVVGAADFGNGVSPVLPFSTFSFVNPDLTVYLSRPPVGEWIGLDARTTLGEPGTALAQSELWDTSGPIGTALQSLYVERRT
ncbi:MAG TPA: thioesterase family protein, partial [Acidimicrobiales bacterium]|nr:thioesterase family protein [Acidimicrobiales bacterium]